MKKTWKMKWLSHKKVRPGILFFTSIFSFLLFFAVSQAWASETNPKQITLKMENASVKEILDELAVKCDKLFFYSDSEIDLKKKISVDLENKSMEEILQFIQAKSGNFTYEITENYVTIMPAKQAKTKDKEEVKVEGKVTDEDGNPLPGATILIKGTNKGVVTNADGEYLIKVSKNSVLIFSFIGFEKQEVVVDKETTIDVAMEAKVSDISEVVITAEVSTGLQTIPLERSTGSFSTVTSKELAKNPTSSNVLQRLEGLIPGVKVDVLSGDRTFAYQNTQIAINGGTRTVGKNDYDMSVRGLNTFVGEQFPLVVVDGTIRDLDISTLNPDDIDNITFLKDAAAASIWGVRAANGVIVITTKKGQKNKRPSVNLSASFSFSEKPDLDYLKTMNSEQMLDYEMELVDKGFIYDMGTPTTYYDAQSGLRSAGMQLALILKNNPNDAVALAQLDRLKTIDNRSQISKYLLQAAASQQYNLSVSGGSDYHSYFYSASYSKETPNTVGNKGERLTLALNNTWELFKDATLKVNFQGSFFEYANNGIGFSSLYASSSTTFLPYNLLVDENGNSVSYDRLHPGWTNTLSSAFKDWTYNYLDELDNADNTQKDNNYVATIELRLPLLLRGLSGSVLYNTERSYSKTRSYYNQNTYYLRDILNYYTSPTGTKNSLGITNGGVLSEINTTLNNYSLRGQLNYNNTIKGKHQINAIAGAEIRQTKTGQSSYSLFGYDIDKGFTNTQINYSYTPSYETVSGYLSTFSYGYPSKADKTRRYLSYYSNASYTLMDRYVFSGSVRYDDYNNFGLDRKYRATPMWSVGFKWHLGKESFIEKYDWINNLAFRMTYGVNGNISTTLYPFTNMSLGSSPDYTTGLPYASIVEFANPELKWEKTAVTNFGLDFGLLNNRLSGMLEVYVKKGTDLLYNYKVSDTYGTSYVTKNAATLKGSGVDLNLRGVIYATKDWNWSTGMTFSYNTNKVEVDNNFTTSSYTYPSSYTNVNGYAKDALFVFRNAGLDENGLTQIYDENGEIIPASTSSITSPSVLKYAGRTRAPFYGSWNTSLQYKNLTFSATLTYQFGGVFLRRGVQNYITNSYTVRYDLSADIADRWRESGDELTTNVPAISYTSSSLLRYMYSDINVLKSDYIRLRDISISYRIPSDKLKKLFIKGASVTFSARNLGLLWKANKEGYDPDFTNPISSTYSLPASRSYNFSLNINF